MILIDTNVIVYSLDADDHRNGICSERLEECRIGKMEGGVTGGILAELAASLTWTGRTNPLSARQCRTVIENLMESNLLLFEESRNSLKLFLSLVSSHRLSGQQVHDAHHAAVALVSGCDEVLTFDQIHWQRFQKDGLRNIVPAVE
ncbi:type II toxin-antitoxin system VapC family toxin [Acidobacteriota bacterium]